jgi:glycosyltransferase involved in cell wall biosynthesis
MNAIETRGFSVVICTYNGAGRLPATIAHLRAQQTDYLFEIILVDNASTDNTAEVARHLLSDTDVLLQEPRPGKMYALEKGFAAARYPYLIVCDDDNWLNKNFIQTACRIMEENPGIGALGGLGEPVCEITPPGWFARIKGHYAVGRQSATEGDITLSRGWVFGAGVVIHKKAWEHLQRSGFTSQLTCRKGDTLSAGGDVEMCLALRELGYKIYYDSRLQFKHFIPATRLVWPYALKLFEGAAKAQNYLLVYNHISKTQTPTARRIYSAILRKAVRILLTGDKGNLFRLFFIGLKEGDTKLLFTRYRLIRVLDLFSNRKTLLGQIAYVISFSRSLVLNSEPYDSIKI